MPPWSDPFEPACWGLMLLVATAASVTDVRRGAIPNRLVVAGLAAAAALHLASWAWAAGLLGSPSQGEAEARLLAPAVNGAAGLAVGFLLFWVGLWSAGDAKLALVLALAQPAWVELRGPLPWAPVVVLLGNGLVVALAFVAAEVVVRGLPRLARGLRAGDLLPDPARAASAASGAARVGVAMAALATALGPVRSWLAAEAARLVEGGPFLTFLLLFLLYRPVRGLALRRWGLAAALLLLAPSAAYSLLARGPAGGVEVLRSLLVAASVMAARGLLELSSRTFDARRVPIDGLLPGMVLSPRYVARLEADRRWQEAFAATVGDLRGVKLDQNLVDNVREWHAHNAPDEKVGIHAPLPFAPALAAGVVLTAWARGLVFHM